MEGILYHKEREREREREREKCIISLDFIAGGSMHHKENEKNSLFALSRKRGIEKNYMN